VKGQTNCPVHSLPCKSEDVLQPKTFDDEKRKDTDRRAWGG